MERGDCERVFDEEGFLVDETRSVGFACLRCGECCRGEIEILLNPDDLGRMARLLGLEGPEALFVRGLVEWMEIPGCGLRPRIRFKGVGVFRCCPFLENNLRDEGLLEGRCALHPEGKPLVCRLAPAGRDWKGDGSAGGFFREPIRGCPGCGAFGGYSVEEALKEVGEALKREEVYFRAMDELVGRGASRGEWKSLHYRLADGEMLRRIAD